MYLWNQQAIICNFLTHYQGWGNVNPGTLTVHMQLQEIMRLDILPVQSIEDLVHKRLTTSKPILRITIGLIQVIHVKSSN